MKINGTDIALYDARQMNVDIGVADISSTGTWNKGAVVPLPNSTEFTAKSLQVVLSVHGDDGREDIIANCSKIISLCKGDLDIQLDWFDHKFKGWLKSASRTERTLHKWHLLTLEFVCYEYGKAVKATSTAVTAQAKSVLTIKNPGTSKSPVILKLTPTTAKASLTVTGICKDSITGSDLPVVIKNLTSGKVVELNGLTGLFTEDGAIKDMTIWGVPALDPGETTITCDSIYVSMTAEVIPIYI